MHTHQLGRTGRTVSVIGLGTWQLGADWGAVDEATRPRRCWRRGGRVRRHASSTPPTSTATAAASRLIGRFRRAHPGPGPHRRHQDGPPGRAAARPTTRWTTSGPGPTGPAPTSGVDVLDLVQLHCPPTAVFSDDAVFDALDTLVAEQRIRGLRGQRGDLRRGADRDRPSRRGQRPDHPQRVPAEAAGRGAAGRGRGRGGHHRPGAAGLGPAVGQVPARHHLRRRRPPQLQPRRARPSTSARRSPGWTSTPAWTRPSSSPRWCARRSASRPRPRCAGWIDQPGVSTVIPGARNAEQARANAAAAALPPL